MRVVIPVADEPHNRSLPYALASIRQHTTLEPLTVGMKDYGLCDHLMTKEPRGKLRKFRGEVIAMRAALEYLDEPFVWSNDDIYWLRPAEPVRWAIGKLEDADTRTIYGQRKQHTLAFLRRQGLPTWDYESHTPLPVHPAPMRLVLDWCDTDPMLDKRSLYGNLTREPDIIAADVKLRARSAPLPDAAWCSTARPPTDHPALTATLTA